MKHIKLLSLFFLVLLVSNSCDDTLDINTDPLVATTADPNALLPYVIVQYSNRHVTELGTRTMDVSQHISACFNSPNLGNTSSFLTGNTWFMMYNQVLGNLQLIEQDAAAAGATSNNIAAIAKTLKALTFLELTSLWEQVPFTEALDGSNFPSPNFDSQETVLKGIVDILDEVNMLINDMPAEGIFNVASGDMIYGGDMDKWQRFANSLKLRTLMMIRNADSSVDGEIATALGLPLMETNDQSALIRYFDTPAESSGWSRLVTAFFGGNGNEFHGVYAPGEPLYDLLSNGDPRFDLFILDPNGDGSPGNDVFLPFDSNAGAVLRNNVIRNDIPHILMTPAEVSLYKAELALDGIGSDAQGNYEQGVSLALQFWGQSIPGAQITLAAADIDAYVGTLGAATTQGVHEQLYLESFMRPVVAWNTFRRTGVPALEAPPASSIGTVLRRFNYPPDEVASNINTPANPPTGEPMWFENQ